MNYYALIAIAIVYGWLAYEFYTAPVMDDEGNYIKEENK